MPSLWFDKNTEEAMNFYVSVFNGSLWMAARFIPKQLGELLGHSNKKKALAAMNAMLKMKKIVVADIQKAFDAA